MTYEEYKIKWKDIECRKNDDLCSIHKRKNNIKHGASAICYKPIPYDLAQSKWFLFKGNQYGEDLTWIR